MKVVILCGGKGTRLREETEPRMDEIRRQADGRLQTVLSPEQWQQFQRLRDERGRRGGRGRR